MSDPLTDAANAISDGSPKIKAFAQLAAQRIEADEAEQAREAADLERALNGLDLLAARVAKLEGTPAPPPATGARIGNGLLLNAQGNSFGTFTDAQLQPFGGCISGSDKSAAFGRLHTTYPTFHGFIYHTVFEVALAQSSAVWPNAVTESQAINGGWIYYDQNRYLVKDSAGDSFICDPSVPAYQAAWSANVATQCTAGATGVFIDNCAPVAWWGARPYKNGAAVTDSQIGDALMSFFAAFKKANPSLYLFPNIGTWDQARVDFCKRAAPVADGIMIEGYTGSVVQQATIQAIQNADCDPWVITPVGVTGGSALARQYAQAFASVWDRKGGGFSVDAAEPANANWTSVIV